MWPARGMNAECPTTPPPKPKPSPQPMVHQRWGDSGAVDASDIRRAEQFIAAADALIAFRMAASGAGRMAACQALSNAKAAAISAVRRYEDGGLDRREQEDDA